jgi:putative heme-binding domain-containing protein
MQHSHGSTAISGLVIMDDPIWPEAYRDNLLVGNVMTSRVNRDRMQFNGSSVKAEEVDDLLSTTDPWFRPVDLQWGPDGALYIADFYNRIIGHYEVPLTHPERDRNRGRIWRVTYHGPDGQQRWNYPEIDLSIDDLPAVIRELGSPNRTRRGLALDFLTDRAPAAATEAFAQILSRPAANPHSRVMALWGLERLDQLSDARLVEAAFDPEENMRVQAFAIMAGRPELSGILKPCISHGLNDRSARVQRLAVRVLSRHPDPGWISRLLAMAGETPASDDHLHHRIRMALRDTFTSMEDLSPLDEIRETPSSRAMVDSILLAVRTPAAALFLASRPSGNQASPEELEFLSRYLPDNRLDALVPFLAEPSRQSTTTCLNQLGVIRQGLQARGLSVPAGQTPLRQWMDSVSRISLTNLTSLPAMDFSFVPDYGNPRRDIPWISQQRDSADGDNASLFLCSLPPGGESWTGTIISREFEIPGKLSFFMAGHRGYPDRDAHLLNYIQLVDASTGQVLKRSWPPRHDTAQPYTWALEEYAGRRGRIEIHDGDTGDAYAWLAAGRFSPPVVRITAPGPRQMAERVRDILQGVEGLQSGEIFRLLNQLFLRRDIPVPARLDIASALVRLRSDEFLSELPGLMDRFESEDPWFYRAMIGWIAGRSHADGLRMVSETFPSASLDWQVQWAKALGSHSDGAKLLAGLIDSGRASRRLLADKAIAEKVLEASDGDLKSRLGELVKKIGVLDPPGPSIDQRLVSIRSIPPDSAAGKAIFQSHCAVCHQKNGEGNLVGPQLDGIGSRGFTRVMEDILDPNSNLDQAFRIRQIETVDGSIYSGLFVGKDGSTRNYVDATGEKFSLPESSIVEDKELNLSPMPSSFGSVLSDRNLADLAAFLMQE